MSGTFCVPAMNYLFQAKETAVKPTQLSIIIALDDHSHIDRVVSALASQTVAMDRHEVLVVDAVADSAAYRQLTRHRQARIDRQEASRINLHEYRIATAGRAVARNYGIEQATGDVLLFLGDDFIPEPQLVAEHLRLHLERSEEHVVGLGPALFPGSLRQDPFTRWLEDSGRLFGLSFTHPDTTALRGFFYGANSSLKRSFLDRVGLFDAAFPFHDTDDYEMGLRLLSAGMETIYLPAARALHDHTISLAERQESMRNAGRSAVILEAKYPERRPLYAACQSPAATHRAAAQYWKLRSRFSRDPQYREKYWTAALATALAEGYQQAQQERAA